MRLSLALLSAGLLAGCAGHVADHIGDRSGIVAPQLLRFGLTELQSQCVGTWLGSTIRPKPLRLFARSLGAVQQGYFEQGRLTFSDVTHVAGQQADPQVREALATARLRCDLPDALAVRRVETSTPEPVATGSIRQANWLNLGAATSGQSIAIDASSIERNGAISLAWFRMTDPGARAPSALSYRLRLDCSARTIQPVAQRRYDAAGAQSEERVYAEGEERALPVEGGTVMEIAYLSLCTGA